MTLEEYEKLKKGTSVKTLQIANKYAGEIYKYEDIEKLGRSLLYGYLYALGIQDGKREERERAKARAKKTAKSKPRG